MPTTTAEVPTVIGDLDHLLAAGRALATLAEPNRDLDALGSDILEIAETLRSLGKGMRQAQERAEETADDRRDAVAGDKMFSFRTGYRWTRDEIDLAHANELKAAREVSARTAKRAMVSLQAIISEIGGE